MGKLDELGDSVRQVIRAYHGSPHDFDKFDASKIGTGEGAQSWGHGLYFAENPAVARAYRDSVPLHPAYQSPEQMAADYLFVHGTPEDAMRVMRDHGSWKGPRVRREMYRAALGLLQDGAPITPKEFPFKETPPRMYEVEIGHPRSAMLDLDAAFSEQSPQVARALEDLPGEPMSHGSRYGGNATVINERGQWFLKMDSGAKYSLLPKDVERMGGASATGGQMYQRLANALGGDAAASSEMVRRGVPGAMYFDQGSRGSNSGTRNIIAFPGTEDSIRILRKYAIPGAVGTGVASQYEEER